jgi:hypothetical protein
MPQIKAEAPHSELYIVAIISVRVKTRWQLCFWQSYALQHPFIASSVLLAKELSVNVYAVPFRKKKNGWCLSQ